MPSEPLNKVYHVINIPAREEGILRDLMEEWQKGKAIRAVGEASKGLLSNPNLAWLIGGGLLAAIAGLVGKDLAEVLTRYFGAVSRATDPEASIGEKQDAVSDMERQLIEILKFFTMGPRTPGFDGGGGSG